MYKACSYCGKVHDVKYKCVQYKQARRYERDDVDKLHNKYAWAKKSREIREAANYLCEVCKAEGLYTYDNLEVHHIIKLREAPEKLLDDDNLVCLCRYHHEQADNGTLDAGYLKNLANVRNG